MEAIHTFNLERDPEKRTRYMFGGARAVVRNDQEGNTVVIQFFATAYRVDVKNLKLIKSAPHPQIGNQQSAISNP